MYEEIGQRIEAAGGRILRSSNVKKILRDGSRITGVEIETADKERFLVKADYYFSSIPITQFFLILNPPPEAEIRHAAEQLYYRDHITVDLVVDGDALFPEQWIYIHSSDVKMARVTNYNNFSKKMAARPGTSVLSVEYFVFQSDEVWKLSDEDLKQLAIDEMEFMGLVPGERIEQSWVVRETESYPTYFMGYLEAFGKLKKATAELENCIPIGRGGMYKYNNMDHSLYTGILAARNYLKVPGSPFDVWSVNIDAEYHEGAPISTKRNLISSSAG